MGKRLFIRVDVSVESNVEAAEIVDLIESALVELPQANVEHTVMGEAPTITGVPYTLPPTPEQE